jgi:hypothetical protein
MKERMYFKGVFCPIEKRERTEIIPTEPEAGNTDEGSESDFQIKKPLLFLKGLFCYLKT